MAPSCAIVASLVSKLAIYTKRLGRRVGMANVSANRRPASLQPTEKSKKCQVRHQPELINGSPP